MVTLLTKALRYITSPKPRVLEPDLNLYQVIRARENFKSDALDEGPYPDATAAVDEIVANLKQRMESHKHQVVDFPKRKKSAKK